MEEYFQIVAKSVSFESIKNAKIREDSPGDITCEQCKKYNIKACIVTYLHGAAQGIITVNPIFWSRTDYCISNEMFSEEDIEKCYPFRVFVGKVD